jgi:hypothetical protein
MRGPAVFVALLSTACGRIGFDGTVAVDAAVEPEPAFRTLCDLAKVTVVANGIPADDAAGQSMQVALGDGCANAPIVRFVSQDDPGVLDPATDRLLLPADELAIIGGGDGPNRALRYLLESNIPPVLWEGSSTATFRERATGRVIATGPVTATHDFALLMVIVDPQSGARVLSGQGLATQGTVASALWFENMLAPSIESNTALWSLVDWTDTDGDAGASAGDTFFEVASGR